MNIILSMTSYGERLKILHTHLNWVKYIPYNFELYIDINEKIPQELVNFFEQTPNAKLFLVNDVGPLTKMYYSLQKHPDDIIFIIDDDLDYSPQWINFAVDSYQTHQKMFSDCVIGLIARKLLINPQNELEIMQFGEQQTNWQKSLNYYTGHAEPLKPSYRNLFLSGGPGSFLNIRQLKDDFFNAEKYLKICKSQDEIWTWVHSIRNNYKHVGLHTITIHPGCINNTQQYGLGLNVNSVQHERELFKSCINEYPEILRYLHID